MAIPDTTLNSQNAIANSSLAEDKQTFDPDSIGLVTDDIDRQDISVDTSDKTITHEEKKDAEKEDATVTDEKKDDTTTTDTKVDDRFDKYPRWQEIMRERDEARRIAEETRLEVQRVREERIRLEAERDFLKAQAELKPEILPYRDTSGMTAEQIAEWMSEDPKGYHDNLIIQARELAKREVREILKQSETERKRLSQEESIKKTYDAYEKDNPDFKKMWESGEIIKFLDANPGHNPISAHQVMTAEKRIKEAAEKAAREAEERTNKNWQAKRQATVIGGGPSVTPTDTDTELQDTKSRGGPIAVLAERLARMRKAAP
jgi:hypothetical protein